MTTPTKTFDIQYPRRHSDRRDVSISRFTMGKVTPKINIL